MVTYLNNQIKISPGNYFGDHCLYDGAYKQDILPFLKKGLKKHNLYFILDFNSCIREYLCIMFNVLNRMDSLGTLTESDNEFIYQLSQPSNL